MARAYRLGLLGAALLMLGLGLLAVLVLVPFRPADESANVAYGLAVADGRLPTLREYVVPRVPGQRKVLQHVANHPPLYFALIAPPLGIGLDHQHALLGLRIARAETLLFGVAGALASAWVALGVRRRRDLALGTAALTGTLVALISSASTIQNDALAMAFSTVAVAGLVGVVLRGLSPGPVAAAAIGTVGSMATRASGAQLAGLVIVGLLLAGLLHGRPRWRGVLVGGSWAVGIVAGCAAAAGWFYLRNEHLYGDWTGAAYLTRTHPRVPGATRTEFLTPPRWYVDVAERMVGGPDGMSVGIKIAFGTLCLGVLVGAVTGLSRIIAGQRGPELPMVLLVAMFVALVASLWYAIATHVSHGGGQHPRYLFPALAILSLAVAGGLRAIPGGPPALWLVAGVCVQAATVLSWLLANARVQHPAPLVDLLPTAVTNAGVAAARPVVVVLLAVAVAGLLLASRSILVLAREPASSRPASTEPPSTQPASSGPASSGPAVSQPAQRPSRKLASHAAASVNDASSRPTGSGVGTPSSPRG